MYTGCTYFHHFGCAIESGLAKVDDAGEALVKLLLAQRLP